MEKGFTQMNIDEWELLCHKTSHTFVQELVLPSKAMEEELLSLGSNIKQQDLTPPSQPNFQATKAEPHEEVIKEDELAQLCKYEKQSEEEKEEEEINDEPEMAFKTTADITSDGNSEGLSLCEEDEGEELGEMVEYTGPESKEKSGRNTFRLRTLLRSAGLAAATFSIFILQKSMPKNQKIHFKLSKNEKPERQFQHQQEVPKLLRATSHSSFSGHYEMWY
ncbi:uncharacterized protein LOC110110987 [Dendrobium catenatum]|uniref:uncharacterized protein LOC110110987 n=1 Tax=Dendrobium catenatum TaxID=906689 RepID=UPI0009F54827|nr:uncharacterized protein LOC110110987 [Dendrobium catenatum]